MYIYIHECTHVYSSKHWCLSFMWEWCQSKYGIPASNIGVWSRIQEVSRLKWNRCSKPHQDAVSMTHRHTKCVGNLLIMYVLVYMYSINYFTYIYITHIYILWNRWRKYDSTQTFFFVLGTLNRKHPIGDYYIIIYTWAINNGTKPYKTIQNHTKPSTSGI